MEDSRQKSVMQEFRAFGELAELKPCWHTLVMSAGSFSTLFFEPQEAERDYFRVLFDEKTGKFLSETTLSEGPLKGKFVPLNEKKAWSFRLRIDI